MNDTPNPFGQLDAQSAESRLAQVMPDEATDHTPDPLHDAEAYRDEPDAHLDAAYEERTEMPDEPQGWPGDGSGTDDLADLMAHGDEGCCDGPEDDFVDSSGWESLTGGE